MNKNNSRSTAKDDHTDQAVGFDEFNTSEELLYNRGGRRQSKLDHDIDDDMWHTNEKFCGGGATADFDSVLSGQRS